MDARQPIAERMRGCDGHIRWRRPERDERNDVDHAEARVYSRVIAQIEVFERNIDEPTSGRLGCTGVDRGDREHAAVVVGIAVDVEQCRAGRSTNRLDHMGVAALRDIDDGLEHRARVDAPRERGF